MIGDRECRAPEIRVKAMEAVLILERIVKDSPAYGARNVQKVTAGTGEALPGPADCGVSSEASCSITGDPGKWVTSRVGVGGGRSTG